MKKKVYTVQADYAHGDGTFLPYAAGTLIAFAKSDESLEKEYEFETPIFKREKLSEQLEKIKAPFLVGFSNYIWNYEYNLRLAAMIKEKYPDCFILFGGHNITKDSSLLDEKGFIDALIFGEGEEVFAALLRALAEGSELSAVPNLAYRKNGRAVMTEKAEFTRNDYPSPYLTGVYEPILKSEKGTEFYAVMETVRGCPYTCAYCDDGAYCGKIRKAPLEKIFAELRWMSDNGIICLGFSDSNFGMFERDEEIIDEAIRLKKEYGVLTALQTSFAKQSNDRVFRINKKLNECGMSKGATLSFQSMDPQVQANIFRQNISLDYFSALLGKYGEAGIPTYTELILGLPGETFESFVQGIDTLLNAGQHSAIYVHNCEWLPLSGMGDLEYIEKYGIKKACIPINQPHCTIEEEEVEEKSRVIVKTSSMTESDWVRMNLYSVTVQALHHHGFFMLVALYLHHALGVKYSDFYLSMLEFFENNPDTVGGETMNFLKNRLTDVTNEKAGLVIEDRRFGDVGWPIEEYAALRFFSEADRFYEEAKEPVSRFFEDKDMFNAVYEYQKWSLKRPDKACGELECEYDFKKYFSDILLKGSADLPEKKNRTYKITNPVKLSPMPDFARDTVWYGRKTKRKIYLEEVEEK